MFLLCVSCTALTPGLCSHLFIVTPVCCQMARSVCCTEPSLRPDVNCHGSQEHYYSCQEDVWGENGARTQVQEGTSLSFNNQMKQKLTKTTPRGKNNGQRAAVQADITHTMKTTDQHRTTDTWRINKETNKEGNEGDTGTSWNNNEVTRWEGTSVANLFR